MTKPIEIKKSNLENRLSPFGLVKNDFLMKGVAMDNPDGTVRKVDFHIIEEDKKTGDVLINFIDLYRTAVQFDNEAVKTGKSCVLYQKRRLAEPKGNIKYQNPKGQPTRPFFPPLVIDTFSNEKKVINHLVIVEGEFKALFTSKLLGIHIIAIAGIWNFTDKNKELHPEINALLENCEVRNITILYDGDARNISEKNIDTDATGRPMSFFRSAETFRACLRDKRVDIFYAEIKSDSHDTEPKGIDDLLAVHLDKYEEITKELLSTNTRKKYWKYLFKVNITSSVNRLRKHFHLHDVQSFYDFHQDIIGDEKFVFRGSRYQYNEAENKVLIILSEAASQYMRVGDTYYKVYEALDARRQPFQKRATRNKGTITDGHGKDIIQQIPKYDGFCNIPYYLDFQKEYNNEYNMQHELPYAPFDSKVTEKDIPNIITMAKHIFGSGEIEYKDHTFKEYELGLDYLQLLLFNRNIKNIPIVGNIRVGNVKEPIRLEMLTSSKYITFMERSILSDFSPTRNSGILLFNDFMEERIGIQAGLFRNAGDNGNDISANNGYVFTGRASGLPIKKKNQL